ncbi:hypothetical protein [Adhaeribacter pallidiroseus]|uniref:Uncharacterized protein n=1 Tax=Adhaeribacter pallidiroseus TaxID=2072847 RepID=A0A369QAY9_9BACT|nr:hypothetical protein [Adhaeribacter pallidiroseus]RDC62081.1 hypothetical protein AHMF7616_00672 [Adhaeribacter pallidiroseus]
MRVVAEIPHAAVKITVFAWNGKYLIKLERGPYEQTYKISEMEVATDEAIKQLLDETFINEAVGLFQQMHHNLMLALERIE